MFKKRLLLAVPILALSLFSIGSVTNAAEGTFLGQTSGLQGVYGGWSEDEGYFTIQPAISPNAITPFAPSAAPKWHKADIRSYSAGASVIREYIVATTEWPDAYHYTVAQYENKYNGNVQASSGRVYGMDQTTAISGDVDGEFRGLYLKAKSYYGR
ncbi:hypothetical protein [Paenibacillus massiliensis]|uniref:hypothetical protein n=1 Tax=Paenibacillus massiliensis TaxID=225917 RepID=UPI0012ECBA0C|nr:hypothetical protein [Paenibacillus massiliensis]